MSGPDSTTVPEVCVVTHPLGAAGENATRTLLEILSAITTVALVTADLPADSDIRGRHETIELTRKATGETIPVAAIRFILNQLRMCVVILRRSERVVLFFGATSYLLPILVARLAGRTVVVEPRGDVPLTLRLAWEQTLPAPIARGLAGGVRALERAGFYVADAIITYTPGMARQLALEPFDGKLFTNGARYVDTEMFTPTVAFENRPPAVGFLGRLDEEKGIRVLAEVASQLPEEVSFRFIGDGPLRSWLEGELESERDAGRVEVTGWIDHDDVPPQVNVLRLLVLPSSPTEGLPTVILEALACGTPVYASPVSGVPDVVIDGETGFLMDDRDPDRIAADIERILTEEPLGTVSANGRRLVENEYSFEAAVDRYRDIFEELA